MVFPVVGGDGKPTGYEIDNSLRFNDADSPVLSRTPSSTGNRRTFTISAWVKRCKDDNVDEGIFNAMVEPYDGQNRFVFGITSAGQLNIYNRIYLFRFKLKEKNKFFHLLDNIICTQINLTQIRLNNLKRLFISSTYRSYLLDKINRKFNLH